MADAPQVSVFLPTLNAGPEFRENVARIRAQELDRPFEVLAIDSGSTDGTVEVLQEAGIRFEGIDRADFDHGLTRNRGIEMARGEVVALITQDARPQGTDWLQRLVDRFDAPEVAGVFSRQIVRPDADPLTRMRMDGWVGSSHGGFEHRIPSPEAFQALDPYARSALVVFDNVSSAVRREVALEVPFRKRIFGEDVDWALRVLLAGHTLVYEPRSAVVHSHDYSAWTTLQRTYCDHFNQFDLMKLRTTKNLFWMTRHVFARIGQYGRALGADPSLGGGERLAWRLRAVAHSLGENLGQYLGANVAERIHRTGRPGPFYKRIDRVLRRGM